MEEKKTKKGFPIIFKRLGWFLLFLLLIPFLVTLLFHVPVIQHWASGKLTGYLSEKMEADVSLSRIDVSMFKGLSLNDFTIRDLQGDTLMNVKSLDVSLSRNLFSLLKKKVEIKSISLVDPKFSLETDPIDGKLNLVKLFEKLGSGSNNSSSGSVSIKIREFYIKNLDFSILDEKNQKNLIARLAEGKINFRKFDLENLDFDIVALNLIKPEFQILTFLPHGETPSENNDDKKHQKSSDVKQLCLNIDKINISDGLLNLDKRLQSQSKEAYIFDPDHLAFHHINLDIQHLQYGGIEDIYAVVNNVELSSTAGFILEKLKIPAFRMNHEMIALDDLEIVTGNSNLGKKVVLRYNGIESLKDFANKVVIDADLENSKISLLELGYFVPSFAKSSFYKKHKNETLELDGRLKGRLANLKGSDLTLQLANHLYFAGGLGVRNLHDPEETLINLRVNKMLTDINFISDIVPGFNPPKNFYLLGDIDFSGNFDGYLKDFVAYGKLKTDLGTANLDLRLDVKKGSDKAKYAGNLHLIDFDLGTWSGNQDFGKLSVKANIRDGESLVFRNARADLEATVERLELKKYNYKEIKILGNLASNAFTGVINSTDPNIDFGFKGSASFAEKVPHFNFDANINNLNLRALNLSKDISMITGTLSLIGEGDNINNLLGTLNGNSVRIVRNDTTYNLGNVALTSLVASGDARSLDFTSDFADVKLEGIYNLNTIVDDCKFLIKSNYPYHTRNWNIQSQSIKNRQSLRFDLSLFDAGKIFGLLGLKDYNLKSFKAKGAIQSDRKELTFVSNLPLLKIKDLNFFNINLMVNNTASKGDLLIHLDSAEVSGRKFKAMDIQTVMDGDEAIFEINASKILDSIQLFEIKGKLFPHTNGYTFSLIENNIKLFDKRWKISNETRISFGKEYLDIENLALTDGTRQLELTDILNRGLALKMVKLDVASINPIINYDKIYLGGELNSTLRIDDIFNPSPSLSGTVNIPNLLLNNDSYGELSLDLAKEENRPMEVLLSLSREQDDMALKLNGEYNFDTKTVDAEVKGKKVSLKFLEYILKAGIKNVKGGVDVDATISGVLPKIKIDGKGTAYGGEVKVIYLGETYYFDNQDFEITESYIDLTGAKLTDSEGNPGFIEGRLNHTLFKDFYLDVGISGENVIAINTTKFDNPIYYGIGRGQVSVDFSGSVNTPRMVINAVTKPGTVINMPIKESRTASSQSFITFVEKEKFFAQSKDSLAKDQEIKVEGISIEMNLSMTQDAVVNMIFDEFKNDIITGVGNGNLRISMSNKGEFDMFGVYTIARGNYLFTAFNFVNKPFLVREGGTIRWTGNPINASLNIEADYAVKTPLTSFLTEYLVTDQLKNAAAVSTAVNLKLILGNTLFNPSVKFDFEFPNLTGELKSYTDSKVRLLRNNVSDYNSQVFGLIVFNSFIPSNTISDVVTNNNFNNLIQNAGINTLSEFVSSQLSMFVTGLVNEALEENGLISGIDFDIDLRNNTSFQSVTGNSSILPTEIEVKLKNKFRFLDERLSINVGGNYVRQNSIINLNNYIVPEFFIEYALTKDRQLNLKLYGKYDLDEISLTSRRQKYGLGLRYKNEFGSMVETKTKLSQGLRKLLTEKDK